MNSIFYVTTSDLTLLGFAGFLVIRLLLTAMKSVADVVKDDSVLRMKPFNCNVCLSGWYALMLAASMTAPSYPLLDAFAVGGVTLTLMSLYDWAFPALPE